MRIVEGKVLGLRRPTHLGILSGETAPLNRFLIFAILACKKPEETCSRPGCARLETCAQSYATTFSHRIRKGLETGSLHYDPWTATLENLAIGAAASVSFGKRRLP